MEKAGELLVKPVQWLWKGIHGALRLFTGSGDSVAEVFEDSLFKKQPGTEDKVKQLLAQGIESGVFEKAEQDMVERVLRLGDLKAGALMTPRTQMTWLDLEEPHEKNFQMIAQSTHSRFPVGKGSMDEFVGIIYSRDILARGLENAQLDFMQLVRTPLFVPKSMSAFRVLESFKQAGVHEAMVLDEYGGVMGIITLHDILEEIVGDMPLSDEEEEPAMVQREDGSWLVDGMLAIDEFQQHFQISELPENNRDGYHTLGGFIISYLGYIPSAGERFFWEGFRIEVVDMDRLRVDKVLISRMENTEKHETAE